LPVGNQVVIGREAGLMFRTSRRLLSRSVSVVVVAGILAMAPFTGFAQGSRSIDGRWKGTWISYASDSVGFQYEALITLSTRADKSVDGTINWTLRRSPRPADQPKIGQSATEFVSGFFEPASGVLRIAGYKKEDPSSMIALDRYHLVIADSGTVLGGITESHGTWQGLISTVRQP
jgi:hypothetical protein